MSSKNKKNTNVSRNKNNIKNNKKGNLSNKNTSINKVSSKSYKKGVSNNNYFNNKNSINNNKDKKSNNNSIKNKTNTVNKKHNLVDLNVSNDKSVKKKYVGFIILGSCIILLLVIYCTLLIFNYDSVKKYDDVILPNFYLDKYDLTNLSYDNAYELIKAKESEILKKKVKFIVNGKEYPIILSGMGLKIDLGKTFREIEEYQKHMSFASKIWYINKNVENKNYKIYYTFDKEIFKLFLTNFNNVVSVAPVNGHLDASDGVKYVPGVDGFTLDVDKAKKDIVEYFNGVSDQDELSIKLTGDTISAANNDHYKTIDTMTSSFVTTYDTGIYLRAQNLRTAINYINGAIIEPGEIFSYHHYAGPYDKEGYVFYYKFYGNGVCQVATTVYNAALLGGLEIVKRAPHDKKSEYVDGGLDATVADYGSWNVDMQWKNTYDYPIYIKAYDYNGEVHVEFWSNHDAKGGKTYSTESRWLGGRSYKSYLHTYKDGQEIDVKEIAYTYYIND